MFEALKGNQFTVYAMGAGNILISHVILSLKAIPFVLSAHRV